jgi:hypothetical protein
MKRKRASEHDWLKLVTDIPGGMQSNQSIAQLLPPTMIPHHRLSLIIQNPSLKTPTVVATVVGSNAAQCSTIAGVSR